MTTIGAASNPSEISTIREGLPSTIGETLQTTERLTSSQIADFLITSTLSVAQSELENMTTSVSTSSVASPLPGEAEDDSDPAIRAARIALGVLAIVIIIVAVIGNVVVICAIQCTTSLRRLNNYLIVSLSLADLGIALFCMPFFVMELFMDYHWPLPHVMCALYCAIEISFGMLSVLTIASISCERVFLITKPMVYQRTVTEVRLIGFIIVLWTVCFSYGFLQMAWFYTDAYKRWQTENPDQCRYLPDREYAIFAFVLAFVVPLSIMLAAYMKIFCVVRGQIQRIHTSLPSATEDGFSEEISTPFTERGKYDCRRRSSVGLPTIASKENTFVDQHDPSGERTTNAEVKVPKVALVVDDVGEDVMQVIKCPGDDDQRTLHTSPQGEVEISNSGLQRAKSNNNLTGSSPIDNCSDPVALGLEIERPVDSACKPTSSVSADHDSTTDTKDADITSPHNNNGNGPEDNNSDTADSTRGESPPIGAAQTPQNQDDQVNIIIPATDTGSVIRTPSPKEGGVTLTEPVSNHDEQNLISSELLAPIRPSTPGEEVPGKASPLGIGRPASPNSKNTDYNNSSNQTKVLYDEIHRDIKESESSTMISNANTDIQFTQEDLHTKDDESISHADMTSDTAIPVGPNSNSNFAQNNSSTAENLDDKSDHQKTLGDDRKSQCVDSSSNSPQILQTVTNAKEDLKNNCSRPTSPLGPRETSTPVRPPAQTTLRTPSPAENVIHIAVSPAEPQNSTSTIRDTANTTPCVSDSNLTIQSEPKTAEFTNSAGLSVLQAYPEGRMRSSSYNEVLSHRATEARLLASGGDDAAVRVRRVSSVTELPLLDKLRCLKNEPLRLQSVLKKPNSCKSIDNVGYPLGQKRNSVQFKLYDDHVLEYTAGGDRSSSGSGGGGGGEECAGPPLRAVLVDDETTGSSEGNTTETSVSSTHPLHKPPLPTTTAAVRNQRNRCRPDSCAHAVNDDEDARSLEGTPSHRHTLQWARRHFNHSASQSSTTISTTGRINSISVSEAGTSGWTGGRSSSRRRSRLFENKAVRMTSYVIGAFIVCWVPYQVCMVLRLFSPDLVSDILWNVTTVIMFMSTAVNPFIYNFYSSQFRAATWRLLKCQANSVHPE